MNNIFSDTSSVFAIIITYNPNIDYLRRLATELATQVERVIVVDNGSGNADGDARVQPGDIPHGTRSIDMHLRSI